MEVESPTFPVVRKVQGCEACAKAIRAIIKAGDPAAEVEVVHWAGRGVWGCHSGRTPQVRSHAPQQPHALSGCHLSPRHSPQEPGSGDPGLTPTPQLHPQEGRGEPCCPREVSPSHPRPHVLDPQPGCSLTW